MASTTLRNRQANEAVRQQGGSVLLLESATGSDWDAMSECPSYNYREQAWADGSDHAHLMSSALLFCGADLASCSGIHD